MEGAEVYIFGDGGWSCLGCKLVESGGLIMKCWICVLKGCWSLCYGSAETLFIYFFDSRWLEYLLSWPTIYKNMDLHSDAAIPLSRIVWEYYDYRSFSIVNLASNVTLGLV